MSRQLRYQRRHAALGLCRLCPRPALLRLRLALPLNLPLARLLAPFLRLLRPPEALFPVP